MSANGDLGTIEVVVVERTLLKEGRGDYGPWTLYKITATDTAGNPIEQEMTTFDALPLNEAVEVETQSRSHPKYGDTLTLKLPKPRTLADRVDELEARVAALEGKP